MNALRQHQRQQGQTHQPGRTDTPTVPHEGTVQGRTVGERLVEGLIAVRSTLASGKPLVERFTTTEYRKTRKGNERIWSVLWQVNSLSDSGGCQTAAVGGQLA